MKTVYELSKELQVGLFDLHKESGFDALCREIKKRVANMKSEVLTAWFAEHGFEPGKAVLVEERTESGWKVYIRESTAEEDVWHKLIGYDRHGNNRNLCNRRGAATTVRKHITCNHCRRKMHMKLLPEFKVEQRADNSTMVPCEFHEWLRLGKQHTGFKWCPYCRQPL